MKQYDRQAVLSVLNYLKQNEPVCHCDHCRYYGDKDKCRKYLQEIQDEHAVWEKRVEKWKKRLN